MSILDALSRGWWQGMSAWPEYVGGAFGLVEDIIPGKQEGLERQEQILKDAAERTRKKGAPGESVGLLEKIAEGIGAAPVDITTFLPAGLAAKGLVKAGKLGKAIGAPAFTFGVTSAIRSGGEGLPTSIGHGLKGAAEGAAFGGIGRWAGKLGVNTPQLKGLSEKLASAKLGGNKAEIAAVEKLMTEAGIDTIGRQALRRGAHAGGVGTLVGGMTGMHGGSVEDSVAAGASMGLLGALSSGKYNRGMYSKEENVAAVAKEIRENAAKEGKKLSEVESVRQAEKVVEQKAAQTTEKIDKDFPDYETLHDAVRYDKLGDGRYIAGNDVVVVKDGKLKTEQFTKAEFDFDSGKYIVSKIDKPNEVFYHGTPTDAVSSISQVKKGGRRGPSGDNDYEAVYVTADKSTAEPFASSKSGKGKVLEAEISPDAKVISRQEARKIVSGEHKRGSEKTPEEILTDRGIDAVSYTGRNGVMWQVAVLNEGVLRDPSSAKGPSITFRNLEQAAMESVPIGESTQSTKSRYGGHKAFFEENQRGYEALTDARVRQQIAENPNIEKAARTLGSNEAGETTLNANEMAALQVKLDMQFRAKDATVADLKKKAEYQRQQGNHAEANEILAEANQIEKLSDGLAYSHKGFVGEIARTLQKVGMLERNSEGWRAAVKKLEKKGVFEKDGSGEYRSDIKTLMQLSEQRPDLQAKLLKALDTPTLFDKMQEYWINGLLSGPPTQMVNTGSNALFTSIDMAEKRAATHAEAKFGYDVWVKDKGTGEKVKERRELTKDQAILENAADLRTAINTIPTALRVGWRLLTSPENAPLPKDMAFAEPYRGGQIKADYRTNAISGTKGVIARLPSKTLQAMDVVFKIINGGRYGTQKALRMAYEAAHDKKIPKTKEAIAAKAEEYLGNTGKEPHPQVLEAMQKEAKRLTFTEDPDAVLQKVQTVRDIEVDLPIIGKVKPLVPALPFTSTPYHVIRQSLKRSPLGILRLKGLMSRYERGDITANEYYREIAATTMGSTVTAGLLLMAKQGLITGGGPVNPQDRQNLIATGWRPYSLHLPGQGYFQLQRLEPLGTILGMAGDLAEVGDSEDKMGKLMSAVKDNITNKSFLYGLESLSAAWSNPQQRGSTYYKQMAGSLVPTLFAKAQQAIDPYSRQTEATGAALGIPDAMAYRIPGMSQALPMRSTPFGEKQERWGVYGADSPIQKGFSAVQSAMSVVPISSEREGTDVEKEFNRLRHFRGMPPAPPKRSKTLVLRGVNGENVKLTNEEYRMYDHYHALAKKQLENVIASPAYQNMRNPEQQAKLLKGIYDKFRSAANKQINASIRRRTTVGD